MFIIKRRLRDTICFDNEAVVTLIGLHTHHVNIGIDAPEYVKFWRGELELQTASSGIKPWYENSYLPTSLTKHFLFMLTNGYHTHPTGSPCKCGSGYDWVSIGGQHRLCVGCKTPRS